MAESDDEIDRLAQALRSMKQDLGPGYWDDAEVRRLQGRLRAAIAAYAAWSEDKPPEHQRARRAARYESQCAALLWPGRGDN